MYIIMKDIKCKKWMEPLWQTTPVVCYTVLMDNPSTDPLLKFNHAFLNMRATSYGNPSSANVKAADRATNWPSSM